MRALGGRCSDEVLTGDGGSEHIDTSEAAFEQWGTDLLSCPNPSPGGGAR